MLPDADLGTPRPRAWMYMNIPSWYDHAEVGWRHALNQMALREGYAIDRVFIDRDSRTDGLAAMLSQLPSSGIRALFVPSPEHLWLPDRFNGESRAQLQELLNRSIFVIDEDRAPIIRPGGLYDEASSARRRRRHWFCRSPRRGH